MINFDNRLGFCSWTYSHYSWWSGYSWTSWEVVALDPLLFYSSHICQCRSYNRM